MSAMMIHMNHYGSNKRIKSNNSIFSNDRMCSILDMVD